MRPPPPTKRENKNGRERSVTSITRAETSLLSARCSLSSSLKYFFSSFSRPHPAARPCRVLSIMFLYCVVVVVVVVADHPRYFQLQNKQAWMQRYRVPEPMYGCIHRCNPSMFRCNIKTRKKVYEDTATAAYVPLEVHQGAEQLQARPRADGVAERARGKALWARQLLGFRPRPRPLAHLQLLFPELLSRGGLGCFGQVRCRVVRFGSVWFSFDFVWFVWIWFRVVPFRFVSTTMARRTAILKRTRMKAHDCIRLTTRSHTHTHTRNTRKRKKHGRSRPVWYIR